MKTIYFIGIDVSKAKLDYTLCKEGDFIKNSMIDNTPSTIRLWFREMRSEYKAGGQNTIFCIEHTGPYGDVVKNIGQAKRPSVAGIGAFKSNVLSDCKEVRVIR